MNPIETLKFLKAHWKSDSKLAFACRLARFGVIAFYYPVWFNEFMHQSRMGKVTKIINGSKMWLDTEDKGVSIDLAINGIREPLMTKVVSQELTKQDVCIDIGANIGYYALLEASLAKKVYAIEPVKESVVALNANIYCNEYKNIQVYEMACGDTNREEYINVSPKRNWSSLPEVNGRSYIRKDLIKMVTLDYFIEHKIVPTFIRMDVEGYEYEIIWGMNGILASSIPLKLCVELHLDILKDKSVVLCQKLKQSGFEVKVACIEPHPVVTNHKVGESLIRFIEKGMGASTGYINISIDDLIHNPIYSNGQVEYLEVLFERR